jgi:predicted ArsR family transcriptional regulator
VAEQWDAVTALADPGRRALFEYIQRAGHPVSREEAADALGISRNLAAFHLDKLAGAGLLQTRYEAPADQPRGRGRTPKVYEPISETVSVSLPPREYQLVAQILADAVAADPADAASAARRIAYRHGLTTGAGQRAAGGDLTGALTSAGYRPEAGEHDRILLANCPFHALATSQTELTCGLNLDYVTGLIDGVRARGCHAHLAPSPGRCCVEITTGDEQPAV